MRFENMKKYQDFSASPRSCHLQKEKQNKILIRAVGSVCKPVSEVCRDYRDVPFP
jgi:hypothetical protein